MFAFGIGIENPDLMSVVFSFSKNCGNCVTPLWLPKASADVRSCFLRACERGARGNLIPEDK